MATIAEYAGEHCKSIGLTIMLALQKLQEKRFREKEMLTEELWYMHGLWQNEQQIVTALEKMSSTEVFR